MRSQPFDMHVLDFKAQSRAKCRRLLLRSLPVAISVLLLAIWFTMPGVLNPRALGDYKQGQYQSARKWLTPLTWTSPERFVAAFNSGTADAAQGNYSRAEKELTRALALASDARRCMTAQNLVFTLKEHAKATKDKKDVTSLTKQAEAVVSANQKCFKGGSSGGGGGSSSSADSTSQAPSETQQQQLEQKEQAGRERQAQFARQEQYDPNDPSIKPW